MEIPAIDGRVDASPQAAAPQIKSARRPVKNDRVKSHVAIDRVRSIRTVAQPCGDIGSGAHGRECVHAGLPVYARDTRNVCGSDLSSLNMLKCE